MAFLQFLKLFILGTGFFSLAFALTAVPAALWLFRSKAKLKEDFLPPVTILKPVKGLEQDLYENLKSFCTLDYPLYQIIFTIESTQDPAYAVLERLRLEFTGLDLSIVVSRNSLGVNPKINNLSGAENSIKHDFILISDSDIKVGRDFLKQSIARFQDPQVGLVTCFYQVTHARGLWGRLEALSVNAGFLPQTLVAAAFGMRFALGAAMLVRRSAFEKSGGFKNLAPHIADDFVLGRSIEHAGYRVEFSQAIVESIPHIASGIDHLRHQARWARTIRTSEPWGYFGAIVLHGFSLLTLKMIFFGADALSLGLAAGLLAAKFLEASSISIGVLGNKQSLGALILLPLSEWIAFVAWLSGWSRSSVLWRGAVYRIEPAGKIAQAEQELSTTVATEP